MNKRPPLITEKTEQPLGRRAIESLDTLPTSAPVVYVAEGDVRPIPNNENVFADRPPFLVYHASGVINGLFLGMSNPRRRATGGEATRRLVFDDQSAVHYVNESRRAAFLVPERAV